MGRKGGNSLARTARRMPRWIPSTLTRRRDKVAPTTTVPIVPFKMVQKVPSRTVSKTKVPSVSNSPTTQILGNALIFLGDNKVNTVYMVTAIVQAVRHTSVQNILAIPEPFLLEIFDEMENYQIFKLNMTDELLRALLPNWEAFDHLKTDEEYIALCDILNGFFSKIAPILKQEFREHKLTLPAKMLDELKKVHVPPAILAGILKKEAQRFVQKNRHLFLQFFQSFLEPAVVEIKKIKALPKADPGNFDHWQGEVPVLLRKYSEALRQENEYRGALMYRRKSKTRVVLHSLDLSIETLFKAFCEKWSRCHMNSIQGELGLQLIGFLASEWSRIISDKP